MLYTENYLLFSTMFTGSPGDSGMSVTARPNKDKVIVHYPPSSINNIELMIH